MAIDRVRALKMETDARGTQIDEFPTALNPKEDFVEARGFAIQNDTSDDENVLVSRDSSNNMTFQDGVVSGSKTLTELVSGSGGITEGSHKALLQLIHFIDDGPADGFASGAYRENTGTVFPTAIIWWTDSGKTDKIVERTLTWTGVNLTTDVWKIYDDDVSNTLLVTVSDSISYSGVFETNRTRTITVH